MSEQLERHPGNARRRRFLGKAWPKMLAAGVPFAVVVLLALPVFSTLQADYYGRYRDLSVRMDHWRASTHGRMSCAGCHVEPGAVGFLSFAGRSIPAFYSQLVVGPKQSNLLGAPESDACQKCHTAYRTVSPDGDLRIPHRAHVEVLKVQCVTCHKDLVHSANAKGFNRPEMKTCLERCHDGKKAGRECVKCHTRKDTPATHAQRDWLEVHGRMSETTDCGSCHDWTPDYCGDCHEKRPETHVGNWKAKHAVRAKERSDGCLVCHDMAAFCKKCH